MTMADRHTAHALGIHCRRAVPQVVAHADIYDELLQKVTELAAKVVVGDPRDPKTQLGPLCNPVQLERVLGYVRTGQEEGARLVCGGAQIGSTGYYIGPTVFADVTNAMAIAREEIFGPVGVFIKFTDTDEAIALANDSDFGLAAGVWSTSLDTALLVSDRLEAGTVWVNGMMSSWGYNAPFGGPKQTGNGHTNGKLGLEQYLITKTVSIQSKGL
jgi:acyl-CoA reductase-like NAD-dependent aldehyde dehydrogenase